MEELKNKSGYMELGIGLLEIRNSQFLILNSVYALITFSFDLDLIVMTCFPL